MNTGRNGVGTYGNPKYLKIPRAIKHVKPLVPLHRLSFRGSSNFWFGDAREFAQRTSVLELVACLRPPRASKGKGQISLSKPN